MDTDAALKQLDKIGYTRDIRAVNEKLVKSAIRQQELADNARLTEQRLSDIINGLNAVICEIDARTGRPTFLSLRTENFLGRPLRHWREASYFLSDIIHPSDRHRATALFPAQMADVGDYEYDFRALSDDDTWKFMRNIVRSVRDQQGAVVALRCIIVDVTAEKQAETALKEAYTREKDITEALQRSILFMPAEDSFPGWTVVRMYEAASDEALVGGDFFDAFACDHGHLALIVGDVTGHGLPAAMFTAELKFTMRGFVREHVEPERILRQMNQYLCESFRLFRQGLYKEGSDKPLCITIAIIDTATGLSRVSSAGMESPLIIRNNGTSEAIEVGGLLLGIQDDAEYVQATFQLDAGDSLVVTTDGITEARRSGVFLGLEGLTRLAKEGSALATLEEMGHSIIEGCRTFGGGTMRDDACVLLARRN